MKPLIATLSRTLLGESTIFGVLGPRRRGKTILANYFAAEVDKAGGRVLHRGNLAFGELLDIEALVDQDVESLGDTLLYLDEVQTLMDSRRAATLFATLVSHNIVQSGHMGMSILWTSQYENRISRDLKDQTDYVLWVTGGARAWPTPEEIDAGDDWRCAGFDRTNPHVFEHIDCPQYDHQRTISADIVGQRGSRVGHRWRRRALLHCAQRFYGLGDTRFMVDSKKSVMGMSAKALQRRETAREAGRLRELIGGLRQQNETMTAADVASYMAGTHDIDWDPAYTARQLAALGVRARTKRGVRIYDLAGFDPPLP